MVPPPAMEMHRPSVARPKPPGLPTPFTTYKSVVKFVGVFAGALAFMAFTAAVVAAGASFGASDRTHRVSVLAVDYDQDAVGQQLAEVYSELKGPQMPTFHWKEPGSYPSDQSIYDEVRRLRYWGAIIAGSNASSNFAAWVNESAGTAQNITGVITYSWNSAYFSSWASATVERSLAKVANTTLSDLLTVATHSNGTEMSAGDRSLPTTPQPQCVTAAVFTSPTFTHYSILWLAVPNSVLILILQRRLFISRRTLRPTPTRLGFIYFLSGLTISTLVAFSTLLSALVFIGHDMERFNGSTFFDLWVTLKLGSLAFFSTFLGLHQLIHRPQLKGAVIWPWTILNMTSALVPPSLSPAVYRWAVAMLGYNVYRLVIHALCRTSLASRGREYGVVLGWTFAGVIVAIASLFLNHRRQKGSEMAATTTRDPDSPSEEDAHLRPQRSGSTMELMLQQGSSRDRPPTVDVHK